MGQIVAKFSDGTTVGGGAKSSPSTKPTDVDSVLNELFGDSKKQAGTNPNPSTSSAAMDEVFGSPDQEVARDVIQPFAQAYRDSVGKVSDTFRSKVDEMAKRLGVKAQDLMRIMSFETGGTFDPRARNKKSGATGLIQFMPSTAKWLGTSTSQLANMSAEDQLDYVFTYLTKMKVGQMPSDGIGDLYMAVLWPAAVGKPGEYVLMRDGTKAYDQNEGLDINNDGRITKDEAARKVKQHGGAAPLMATVGPKIRQTVTVKDEPRQGSGVTGGPATPIIRTKPGSLTSMLGQTTTSAVAGGAGPTSTVPATGFETLGTPKRITVTRPDGQKKSFAYGAKSEKEAAALNAKVEAFLSSQKKTPAQIKAEKELQAQADTAEKQRREDFKKAFGASDQDYNLAMASAKSQGQINRGTEDQAFMSNYGQIANKARTKGGEGIPSNSPEGIAARKKALENDRPKRFASGIIGGANAVIDDTVRFGEMLGWKDAGKLSEETKRFNDAYFVESGKEDFSDKIAQGIGSSLPFFLTGVGIASGASKVAGLSVRASRWLASGGSALMEAATNAGGVYGELVDQGVRPEVAKQAAMRNYVADAVAGTVLNRFGEFARPHFSAVRSALMAMPSEAIEEAVQTINSNINTNKPWDKDVLESAGIGAIVGGIMGGGSRIIGEFDAKNPGSIFTPKETAKNYKGKAIEAPEQIPLTEFEWMALNKILGSDKAFNVATWLEERYQGKQAEFTSEAAMRDTVLDELFGPSAGIRGRGTVSTQAQTSPTEASVVARLSEDPAFAVPQDLGPKRTASVVNIQNLDDDETVDPLKLALKRIEDIERLLDAKQQKQLKTLVGKDAADAAAEDARLRGELDKLKKATLAEQQKRNAVTADPIVKVREAEAEAAASPLNDLPEPTDAQKEAGNYKKGNVKIQGLDVAIESPKGSIRRSREDAKDKWEVEMPATYGYIRGTKASDGDPVDLFIGDQGDNGKFFVINQNRADSKQFDEPKVITGVNSAEEAVDVYKRSFAGNFGERIFDSVSDEMTADEFKAALPELEKAEPFRKRKMYGDVKAGMNYETFKSEVERAFREGNKYRPDQAGSKIYTQLLADLADSYPDFQERFDAEMEAELQPAEPTVKESLTVAEPEKKPSYKIGDRLIGQEPKTIIGQATDGVWIAEDKDGIRYRVNEGVVSGEPVGMIPTRSGIQMDIPSKETRARTRPEYATAEEVAEFGEKAEAKSEEKSKAPAEVAADPDEDAEFEERLRRKKAEREEREKAEAKPEEKPKAESPEKARAKAWTEFVATELAANEAFIAAAKNSDAPNIRLEAEAQMQTILTDRLAKSLASNSRNDEFIEQYKFFFANKATVKEPTPALKAVLDKALADAYQLVTGQKWGDSVGTQPKAEPKPKTSTRRAPKEGKFLLKQDIEMMFQPGASFEQERYEATAIPGNVTGVTRVSILHTFTGQLNNLYSVILTERLYSNGEKESQITVEANYNIYSYFGLDRTVSARVSDEIVSRDFGPFFDAWVSEIKSQIQNGAIPTGLSRAQANNRLQPIFEQFLENFGKMQVQTALTRDGKLLKFTDKQFNKMEADVSPGFHLYAYVQAGSEIADAARKTKAEPAAAPAPTEKPKESARDRARRLMDEAGEGLDALFSPSALFSGSASGQAAFDAAKYAEAKPKMEKMWSIFRDAAIEDGISKADSIDEFIDWFLDKYGMRADAYIRQFNKEVIRPDKSWDTVGAETTNEQRPDISNGEGQNAVEGTQPGEVPQVQSGGARPMGEQSGKNGSEREEADGVSGREPASDRGTDGGSPDGDGRPAGESERDVPATSGVNFRVEDPAVLLSNTDGQRRKALVSALTVLKTLNEENRSATEEEQYALAAFPGWGWTGNIFNVSAEKSSDPDFYRQIESLLSPDDFDAAKIAILNSHYTSFPVVKAMWEMATRLGYSSGPVLEPSAGIGFFLGMAPEGVSQNATAVEMDRITGQILQRLYPQSDVRIQPYQRTSIKANQYAMVIGNVPFGAVKVTDIALEKEMGAKTFASRIHNYFMVRSVRDLAPGGIAILISSHRTLDTTDGAAVETRRLLSNMANLVGAIRLPMTAFKGNAATDVVTDIIILQKRAEGTIPGGPSFQNVSEIATLENRNMLINEYFVENPQMVLGAHSSSGKMNARNQDETEYTLAHPNAERFAEITGKELTEDLTSGSKKEQWDKQIGAMLAAVTELLPEGIVNAEIADGSRPGVKPPAGLRPSSIFEVKGEFFQKIDDYSSAPVEVASTVVDQLRGLIGLREAVYAVLDANREQDGKLKAAQKTLNKVYDQYVEQFGRVNLAGKQSPTAASKNKKSTLKNPEKLLSLDPGIFAIKSLEVVEVVTDSNYEFVRKADIFSERVINYTSESKINSINDAVVESLRKRGRVDFEFIEQSSTFTKADIVERFDGDQIFEDTDGTWLHHSTFLSGNVRARYNEYKQRLDADPDNQRLETYVKALEEVLPARIEFDDIIFKAGASYVTTEIMSQFIAEVSGQSPSIQKTNGTWSVRGMRQDQILGSPHMKIDDFVTTVLNNGKIKVKIYQTVGETEVYDPVASENATKQARNQADQFQLLFRDWLSDTENRRAEVVDAYNNLVNVMALPKYDGSILDISDMSVKWQKQVRPHQLRVAFRMTQDPFLLMYHEVGSGKTANSIIGAMQLKRMGIANKPLFIVKNNTEGQFAATFREIYPGANILFVDDSQWNAKKRQQLTATIASNNFDAIIIRHSDSTKIGVTEATYELEARRQINILKEVLAQEMNVKEDSEEIDLVSRPRPSYVAKTPTSKLEKQIAKQYDDRISAATTQEEKEAIRAEKMEWINTLKERLFFVKDEDGAKKRSKLSPTAKNIAKQLSTLQERLQAQLFKLKQKKDKGLPWEDLGIDTLIVDESHQYKKITTASVHAEFGVNGSQMATDLLIKMNYLRLKGGRSYFLSGTPITNSLSELHGLFTYLRPDLLKELGMSSFDSWINAFGKQEEKAQVTVTGAMKQFNRIKSFINTPELLKLFYSFTDLVKTDDIPGLARPQMMDEDGKITGKPIYVMSTPNDYQISFYKHLGARAKKFSEQMKGGNREYIKTDMLLKMATHARQATVDIRLIDKNAPDLPDSKINQTVRNILNNYLLPVHQESVTDDNGDVSKKLGTQLIFLDQGTPKAKIKPPAELTAMGIENDSAQIQKILDRYEDTPFEYIVEKYEKEVVNEDGETETETFVNIYPDVSDRFDLYADIKEKLVAAGIPEEEIRFMHDVKDQNEKAALFAAMNAGRVRVLITSTQKGATGLNVQDRLYALHHVDPTWTPAEMEQRIGRAMRQGNKWFEWGGGFKNYMYVMKDSFDQFMYNVLGVKDYFIRQTRTPEMQERELVFEDERNSFTPQEITAITSSIPEVLEAYDVTRKLENLQFRRDAFDNIKLAIPNRIQALQAGVRRLNGIKETIVRRNDQAVAWYQDAMPQLSGPFQFRLGNSEPITAESMKPVIADIFDSYQKKFGGKVRLSMSGEQVREAVGGMLTDLDRTYATTSRWSVTSTIALPEDSKKKIQITLVRRVNNITQPGFEVKMSLEKTFAELEQVEEFETSAYLNEINAPTRASNDKLKASAMAERTEFLEAKLAEFETAKAAKEVIDATTNALRMSKDLFLSSKLYEDFETVTGLKLPAIAYKGAALVKEDNLKPEQQAQLKARIDKAFDAKITAIASVAAEQMTKPMPEAETIRNMSMYEGYSPESVVQSIRQFEAQIKTLERKQNQEFPEEDEYQATKDRMEELKPFIKMAEEKTQFGEVKDDLPVGFEHWNKLLKVSIAEPVGGNADNAGEGAVMDLTDKWQEIIASQEGRGSMRSDSEAETQDTPGEDVLAHRWSRLRSQRIQPAGLPGGFDKKIRDIYDALETMAQRRVQQSRRKMRGASGMYYPGTGAVHVRNANDLDTALHEIGHALDDMLGVTDDQFDGEIEWFWQRGGSAAPSQSADYNRWEGTAEFIRAWFVNPDAARKQAPNFADHFEALLKDSGLLAEAEDIQQDVRRYHGASAVEKTFSTIITQRDENGPRSPWFTSIGINWVRGIYRTSPLDVIRRWTTNEQAAFETAVKVAMQTLKMDPSKVQPSKNPITLIDTLRYAHAKHDAWMQYGVTDAAGNIVTPPAKLIFDMLDLSTEETLKADYRDLVVLLVNERVVEKAEQLALKAADTIARYEVRALDALAKFEQETVDKAMLEEKSWLAVREDRITREFNTRMAAIVQGTQTTGTEQAAVRTWRKDELTKLKNSWDKRIAGITGPIIAGARAEVTKRIKRFTDRTMKSLESAQAKLTGAGAGSYNATVLAQQSIQEIAANPSRYARLTLAAATYRNRADAVLRYWVEKGRMTEDQYKTITAANESYAAMQRLVADEDGGGQIQARAQSKVGSMKQPVKKFTGSTKDINDPIVNLLQNEFAMMYEADRNEVMVRFVELLEQRRSMASQNPTVKNLASIGWQVSQDGQGDKVRVFRNGKIEYWQFEAGIMESIKMLEPSQLPQFLHAIVSAPIKMIRTLVTKLPAFQIKNRIRDTQSVLMRGRYAINPVDLVTKAKDDEQRLYNIFGGGLGPKRYLESQRDYYQLRDVLVEEMRRDKKYRVISTSDLLSNAKHWVKRAAGKYEDVLERSEMAPRLAEIRAALRKADPQIKGWAEVRRKLADAEAATNGGNMVLAQQLADEAQVMADRLNPDYQDWGAYDAMLDAAAASREIVDFAKAGTLPRWISTYVIPFFNARIRGVKGGIDAAQRDPLGYSLKFMIFAMIPKLLQFWWNEEKGDQERYKQLPEYLRDTALVFVPKDGGPMVVIPMEHDVAVFSSIVERTLHANGVMTDRDAYANLTSVQALSNVFLPADENSLAMTGWMPLFWATRNQDPRWSGKSIVSEREAKMDVAERTGDERASGAGKSVQELTLQMRKFIGAIPAVDARTADFIMDAYGGYASKILRQTSNIGTDKAASPTKWANVLGGVVYETPGMYSRDVVAVREESEKMGGKNPFEAEFKAIYAEKDAKRKEELTRNLISKAAEMRRNLDEFISKGGGDRNDKVKAFFGIKKKGEEEPKAPKSFSNPGSSPRMRPPGFRSLSNF